MPYERIAIVETKLQIMSEKFDKLTIAVDNLTSVLTEARGARRLVSFASGFLGVSTLGGFVILVDRWREFTHWVGALGN